MDFLETDCLVMFQEMDCLVMCQETDCLDVDCLVMFQEMDCLEDHLKTLQPSCKEAVEKYVEDVEKNPELDKIFSDSCKQFWLNHCKVSS